MILEKNKIVVDSGCDLNLSLKEKLNVGLVPLKINVDGKSYVDDGSIDIKELLLDMKISKEQVKTASPSPSEFMKEYEKGENIFVVTISSALSSTYNNAMLAKDIILEQSKEKFIHVFDSLSASIGETLVSMKINELIENKLDKFDIVEEVEGYIDDMKTFFVLESLDNLVKAGRISKFLNHIGSILSIKPIMGSNDDGTIRLVEKTRGKKRAFNRLVEVIGEQGEKLEEKILGISHCNAPEKAEQLKEKIEERYNFKDVIIVETAGLSSVYANDGGIVIAF